MEGKDGCESDAGKDLCGITVEEVIHGGKFWVSEPPGANMSVEREELMILEKRLADIMSKTYEITAIIPQNKLIAVKNNATGHWHRGELLSPMPEGSTSRSRVFLVDHGGILMNVKVSHLQPLPEVMQHLPPQAFVVCLYGLIPLTVDLQLEDLNDKFHYVQSPIWTPVAERFAQDMLKLSTSAHLNGYRVEGHTIHGEIFLKIQGRGLVSLNKEILRKKYAFYSEQEYEKVIKHEIAIENRIRINKKALLEAEKLQNEKENQSFNIETIKHILMEDFMKEYASKKLLRQEKAAHALEEIKQNTDMRGLQASDDKKRETLEAQIFSSATKNFGRASVLNSRKEKDSNLAKGRGLPSPAVRTRKDSAVASRPIRKSGHSLLSLLDSFKCEPVEKVDVGQVGICKSSSSSPLSMIPAGYPIMIHETTQKGKKEKREMQANSKAEHSQSAVKCGPGSNRSNSGCSSSFPRLGDNGSGAGVLARDSVNVTVRPHEDSFLRDYKTKISEDQGVSSDANTGDNFVQMCKLYAERSSLPPRDQKLKGMFRPYESEHVTSFELLAGGNGSENASGNPRRERSVNPLLSLLDMVKKKSKVNITGGTVGNKTPTNDKQDSIVSEENKPSITEANSELNSKKSPSTKGQMKKSVGVPHVLDYIESASFTTDKNLKQDPGSHQACGILNSISENEGGKLERSNCISKGGSPNSLFSVGEWKDVSYFSDAKYRNEAPEKQLTMKTKEKLMEQSTLMAKNKYGKGLGRSKNNSSEVFNSISKETEDMTLRPVLSENQECNKLQPLMANKVGSYNLSRHEIDEKKIRISESEGSVPETFSLAPSLVNETQPYPGGIKVEQENKVSVDELSQSSTYVLELSEFKSEINNRTSISPKNTGMSQDPRGESSLKPEVSSSLERLFKFFQSRKQVHVENEPGKAKFTSEDILMNDPDANMNSKETQVSDDINHKICKDRDLKMKLNCSSSVIHRENETKVNNLENENMDGSGECFVNSSISGFSPPPEVSDSPCEGGSEELFKSNKVDTTSAQSEHSRSSDFCGSKDDGVDESISREMCSLAKSLSKIEAEENSKVYDAIKNKGLSLQNLSVRLPLCAAQESIRQCKSMERNEEKTSRPPVTPPAEKMKDIEMQKTLEPEVVKPVSVVQPPLPLLLGGSWETEPASWDCFLTSHRIKMCRVLVRGHFLSQPIQSIAQAPFKNILHTALSALGYRDPMRIQTYAWPALMRGHNLILINPPRSGKTLGYLLPIISFMLSQDLYTELPAGNGPLVLILCPSWNAVNQISNYCHSLLKEVKNPPRIIAVYGGLEEEQMIPLVNGCDILITTPRCCLRVFGDKIVTNMDRICHLVFDEADTMMKKFLPEVKDILRDCRQVLQKRARLAAESNPSGDSELYQVVKFIAAAKTWCPQMESFVKTIIEKPLLCIGSYLEAAVYAQLKPALHIVGFQEFLKGKNLKSKNRTIEVDNIVLGVLKKTLGFEKFIVVCESADAVQRLAPKINDLGAHLIVVHEHQHHVDIAEMRHTWLCSQLSGALPVLLISDETLSEFNIGDGEHLVHVGIPVSSKTKFGLRFSTLMDNYRDIFATDCKEKNCPVDIVVDMTEPGLELSGLIEFLQRLGMSIPPELDAVASKSLLCNDMKKKKDLLLCPNLKSFGECDVSACKYRHTVLPTVDQPSEGMPTNGEVHVKILHVLDASCVSARLLEHIRPDGTRVQLPNDYFHIAAALTCHFRNQNNLMLHGHPEVGDMCALETEHNLYQRAQVEAILTRCSESHNPIEVSVILIDEGIKKIAKVYKLLYLPHNLKKYPGQAKELIICRLMPRDLDTSWSKASSVKVAQLLEESNDGEQDGKKIIGMVALALGNTLWVDSLECREWLAYQKINIIHMTVHRDLISSNLAIDNPGHVQKLRKLCDATGFLLPKNEIVSSSPDSLPHEPVQLLELPEVQSKGNIKSAVNDWELLNCDDLFEVNVVAVENPFCFRVQKVSNTEHLSSLSDEIQSWISEIQQTSNSEGCATQKDYDIGSICLGFCKADNSWCRAKVLDLKKTSPALNDDKPRDTEGENHKSQKEMLQYELFFVDYGDTAYVSTDEMLPIPEKLILQLPFQAIECSLMGVKPIRKELESSNDESFEEKWDEEASDAFFKLCRDSDDVDLYRSLLAKVFGTGDSGEHGGLKYLVVLYDKGDKAVKRIGESLVEKGFAEGCQVIVGDGPEDEECLELESHWFGEGALLPFAPALEDSPNQSVVQSEDSLPVSNDTTVCSTLVPVHEGNLREKSENGTEISDNENGSDSFEIVMSDDEVTMLEERLASFLGIPLQRKEGTRIVKNSLKAIEPSKLSLDDHSSLASYEIIPESPTPSLERFVELPVGELTTAQEKSEISSIDMGEEPKDDGIIHKETDCDDQKTTNDGDAIQIVSCFSKSEDTEKHSPVETPAGEQKHPGLDMNADLSSEQSLEIERNPVGIDGLVGNEKGTTEESIPLGTNSCGYEAFQLSLTSYDVKQSSASLDEHVLFKEVPMSFPVEVQDSGPDSVVGREIGGGINVKSVTQAAHSEMMPLLVSQVALPKSPTPSLERFVELPVGELTTAQEKSEISSIDMGEEPKDDGIIHKETDCDDQKTTNDGDAIQIVSCFSKSEDTEKHSPVETPAGEQKHPGLDMNADLSSEQSLEIERNPVGIDGLVGNEKGTTEESIPLGTNSCGYEAFQLSLTSYDVKQSSASLDEHVLFKEVPMSFPVEVQDSGPDSVVGREIGGGINVKSVTQAAHSEMTPLLVSQVALPKSPTPSLERFVELPVGELTTAQEKSEISSIDMGEEPKDDGIIHKETDCDDQKTTNDGDAIQIVSCFSKSEDTEKHSPVETPAGEQKHPGLDMNADLSSEQSLEIERNPVGIDGLVGNEKGTTEESIPLGTNSCGYEAFQLSLTSYDVKQSSASLDEHVLFKEVPMSFPVEVQDSDPDSVVGREIGGGINVKSVTQAAHSEMTPLLVSQVALPKNVANELSTFPSGEDIVDSLKVCDSIKKERVKTGDKETCNSCPTFEISEINKLPEELNSSCKSQPKCNDIEATSRLMLYNSDEKENLQAVELTALPTKNKVLGTELASENKASNENEAQREEAMIVLGGGCKEVSSNTLPSKDVSERGVTLESSADDASASSESDSIQTPLQSSANYNLLKDESLTLGDELYLAKCTNISQKQDLFPDDSSDAKSDVNIGVGSIASDQPSVSKSGYGQISVKPLMDGELPQCAEAVTNEGTDTNANIDQDRYSERGSNASHENQHEVNPYIGMPDLIPAKSPQVKWFQSKWEVVLTIKVTGMKQYRIHWESNKTLWLHASSGSPNDCCYALELELWASINTEKCVHMPISNDSLKIILPKGFSGMEWPRLMFSQSRPLWLSVDFDCIIVDDDEDPDERPMEVINYNESDDEMESEDEQLENGIKCEEVNYDPYDPFN